MQGLTKLRFELHHYLFRTTDISAEQWNSFCWYASLYGYAERVMGACNEAVQMQPEASYYYRSRGLARALTGDMSGAIEDLQFYYFEYGDNQVQYWIDTLEEGENPFTEGELEELR